MAFHGYSSQEEFERQLNPSRWSKRLDSDAVIKEHMTQTKNATEKARKEIQCELDIQYHESGSTLDIYYPHNETGSYSNSPLFVFFHGGNWQALSKDHGGSMAVTFTKAGVIVVVVDYTLCPNGTITKIVEEGRSACCFVRRRFPTNRLFLCGHSCGSHITACIMCTDWSSLEMINPQVTGIVFLSGEFDLEVFQYCSDNTNVKVTEQEVKNFTPIKIMQNLSVKDCKCLFYYAENDPDEYKRQGKELLKALTDSSVSCKYEEFPQLDHFDIIDNFQLEDYKLSADILQFVQHIP
ncbi:kynurenine formamidase-like [Dysidea avara]|uniref:kynurenine formamidase-like n=1 Tax=Dysidea avara TaxID=196820 RepID=UPI00332D52A5